MNDIVHFENGSKRGCFTMYVNQQPWSSADKAHFAISRGSSFIKCTLTVQELRELSALCLEAAQKLERKAEKKEVT